MGQERSASLCELQADGSAAPIQKATSYSSDYACRTRPLLAKAAIAPRHDADAIKWVVAFVHWHIRQVLVLLRHDGSF